MKYTNYGKVNAIAPLNNFSIDKPVETVNNAIVCNANKTNKMLNITELHELVSRALVGKRKCKIYTDSKHYVGIGTLKFNCFSIHAKKSKYVIYTDIEHGLPTGVTVKLFGNSTDKLRPHKIEINDTATMVQCINSVVNMFS